MIDCPATASLFARLHCNIDSNFVAWWKAASIVVTAVLGILGLLKDFKDKKTHRITRWGWILLGGLIISATLGVAAQLQESHDQAALEGQRAAQTLSIVQNTSNTVNSIKRLMSTLAGARVDVTYSLNCVVTEASPCAARLGERDGLAEGQLSLFFFADPASARRFTDGAMLTAKPDLEWILQREGRPDQDSFGESGSANTSEVTIPDYNATPADVGAMSNRIVSLVDLPGATVIVIGNENQLDSLAVTTIKIRIRNGQSMTAGPFEKISIQRKGPYLHAPGPQVAYRYVFPNPSLPG
jgi:hypothetical protein